MKKLITLILCVAAITYSTGALAADTLIAETNLTAGQNLVSRNGVYSLVMQTDGNLVLYYLSPGSNAVPTGFSSGRGGSYARMQMDGNFVVYKSNGTWHWTSQTGGRPYDMSYKLQLTDDGSLFIRDGAGNVIKHVFADTNCGGRQPVVYPVCVSCTANNYVIASCGTQALTKASQMGATLGACY